MAYSPEDLPQSILPSGVQVEGHEHQALTGGWEAAGTPAGACPDPAGLSALDWRAATAPGTAAGVLAEAGEWQPGAPLDLDAEDWWFRTSFQALPAAAGEEVALCFDGIATVCEVYLNGVLAWESDSMFATQSLDVGAQLRGSNELAIRCLALAPLLRERRRPRARWRTRLADGNLRWFRTMLLGRAPGFAPGPAVVGPWRGVRLERRRVLALDELGLRTRVQGTDGVLEVRARLRTLGGAAPASVRIELTPAATRAGPTRHSAELTLTEEPAGLIAAGRLTVPELARWWPHTHGEPNLYRARLLVGPEPLAIEAGRVGFRTLTPGRGAKHDVLTEGLDLHVNGVRVFARGAVWTPIEAAGRSPDEAELRGLLELVRAAGMNMLRLAGTGAYESATFHDLCDELGILVWQDFMFANYDYPIAEQGFRATVEREARETLERLGGRPSLAVLCGNSEVEQQAAMLGLDPALGRGELFGELLPELVQAAEADAVYLPSAPCGGEGALPFRTGGGVSNYFGVGGYRRPIEDARRAGVRFASECLAFANVPDDEALRALLPGAPLGVVVHHPRWKAGVPRDVGSGWDFDDVRDHYLGLLYGVDPGELRRVDHERYLELSRAVSGEAMAAVFGEWRRGASPCGGGIVLWLKDLAPGAGWGVLDHRGEPKVAYHHLRRALAAVAVWTTDEGLGGVGVHFANDGPAPLRARLRVACYRDGEQLVGSAEEQLELPAHSVGERDLEALLGRFVDASWAYRFGPPAQDLIVASLEQLDEEAGGPISQSFHFPAGRPLPAESLGRLGLSASARVLAPDRAELTVRSRRLAWGVRVHTPGYEAEDDAFSIEPGMTRTLLLRARNAATAFAGGSLSALNLEGRAQIAMEEATAADRKVHE